MWVYVWVLLCSVWTVWPKNINDTPINRPIQLGDSDGALLDCTWLTACCFDLYTNEEAWSSWHRLIYLVISCHARKYVLVTPYWNTVFEGTVVELVKLSCCFSITPWISMVKEKLHLFWNSELVKECSDSRFDCFTPGKGRTVVLSAKLFPACLRGWVPRHSVKRKNPPAIDRLLPTKVQYNF
jgi:hypothetical protein